MSYRPRCAPEPGEFPTHPWRYRLGDEVYVRTWLRDETFKVLGGFLHKDFPHYQLLAPDGEIWEIAQLEVHSHPRYSKER